MVCIGGLSLGDAESFRLVRPDFPFWKSYDEFAIGKCYKIEYQLSQNRENPHHVENVVVTNRRHLHDMTKQDIITFLRKYDLIVHSDDPRDVFSFTGVNHPIQYDRRFGKFYAVEQEVNRLLNSVGFWEYPGDLNYVNKEYCGKNFRIKYVGCEKAIDIIPRGTIIRLSTSGLWKSENIPEKRSYMQVSGWF